jgi:hypothetical protein
VLKVAGRDRTHLIDGMEKQIDVVRGLVERLSPQSIDVPGAPCFVDLDGLPLIVSQSVRGVLVDGTRAVATLARRPGPLSEEEIATLSERLARLTAA